MKSGKRNEFSKRGKENVINAVLFTAVAIVFLAISTINTRADEGNSSVSGNEAKQETKQEKNYGSNCSCPSMPIGSTVGTILVNGQTVFSTVPGMYITNTVPGAAITSNLGTINTMVGVQGNERAYAEILDSNCGPAAKSMIAMAAMQKYYLPGPMLDINIGKRNAYGAIEYPAYFMPTFSPDFTKLIRRTMGAEVGIPSGYLIPGYEPALLCLGADATLEVIPADYFSSMSSMHVSISKPRGVYMMIQAPMGTFSNLKMERMNYYLGLSDVYPSGF